MKLEERIEAFAQLGVIIENLTTEEHETLYSLAAQGNPWFTKDNTEQALRGIAVFLSKNSLIKWTNGYELNSVVTKKVGVAMAGNIPLVGFHDLLCVLMAGHTLIAKLSSQDTVLMNFISTQLKKINPVFNDRLLFEERLNDVDAVIATGSDNTSRYFEYYFRKIPHIIRKNRSSCAVIMGEEPSDELIKLGSDAFSYFGLGCRNISKIFIPEGYDLNLLLPTWGKYKEVVNHHKYANNYDYQKCILLMNQNLFYDSGYVLLIENQALVSPISVLYYEYYKNLEELKDKLQLQKEKIQCIVSAKGWYPSSIPFGKAQFPQLGDYADNVDTMQFLSGLGT
ncbi:MAG: acyl-CoA reductase [Cyclobacteriaceae bacterium]